MKTWRDKAERIVENLCRESWKQANFKTNGQQYRRHRPYSVPKLAEDLVNCLGMHDQQAAELRAKQIFAYELQTAHD